jgi:GNAT superfamily N-acetyltransferase
LGTATCGYWNPEECEGTPACPPRCPRFTDTGGKGLLAVRYRPDLRDPLEGMYAGFTDEHRTMGLPPAGENRHEEWLTRLLERGTNLLVLDDDQVIGHGAYSPRWGPDPEMVVFVHPDHHGRGIGSELSRQLVAHAAASGLGSLRLTVDANNEPALSVYRSLGFRINDRRGNDVEMVLPFTDPVARRVQEPPARR